MITQSNVKTGTTWHEYFSRVVFLQKFQTYGRERERERERDIGPNFLCNIKITFAISKMLVQYIYIYILNLN